MGGLGTKQGEPVVYEWAAQSAVPALVPWLAILALLGLKKNRCAAAWWVWVPLICVGGAGLVPQSLLGFLPNSQFEIFLQLGSALGFGVAAVWLLAGNLEAKHRVLAFFGILVAQVIFSAMAFAFGLGMDSDTAPLLVPLSLAGLVIAAALSLAGLLCRGKYGALGWLRLSLWLLAMLALVWLLIIGPFFFYARLMSGGNIPATAVMAVELVAVTVTFCSLLPFLVLAFMNPFYRERLKGLLHLDVQAPPVVPPPAPDAAETPLHSPA